MPTKAKILILVTDEWLRLGFPIKKIHCRTLEAKFKWEQEWVGKDQKFQGKDREHSPRVTDSKKQLTESRCQHKELGT